MTRVLLALAVVVLTVAPQDQPGSRRNPPPLTFLQLNDVYSTVPVADVGGLARVATLKQRIAAGGNTPFFILAGDFLSSSVASTVFKGEQMIAALNAAGLDLATLGNHEFDFGVDVLLQRMAEAKWQWVVSNVVDVQTGRPIGGAAPYAVKTFGALKVGFIGLSTSEGIAPDKLTRVKLIDPLEAAATYLPALRSERVDVIVAVTHLSLTDDRALAERFPDIDIIIGGHEHFPIAAFENRTLISKAGTEARFVARIDVDRRPSGTIERLYELVPITGALPDEPRTAAVVKSFEDRLGKEFDTVVGTTRVPLDAETVRLRVSETNIGNLFADIIRAEAGADLALFPSGSIRGDRIYPAGPLTRRMLIEMHPFGNMICKVAVTGRVVLQALNNGFSMLPDEAGRFPQVSGLTLTVDPRAPPGDRVRDVRVGGRPIGLDTIYTVAISDYMLGGGDDYTMFAGQRLLTTPETGSPVLATLEKHLAGAGEIAPTVDGRITILR